MTNLVVQGFDYYLSLVGYPKSSIDANYNEPKIEYVWYGYKNGVCAAFLNKKDAEKFSSIVEEVPTLASKERQKIYWDDINSKELRAVDLWLIDVFDYFKCYYGFTSNQIQVIYNQAHYDSHVNGHNSVFSKMLSYAAIIKQFMKEN